MHLLQFSLRFFCLIAYKEIILLRLRLFLATQDSCLAIFLSISSEESNERNDCSADCCAAAHVHWSVNNLNCAGLSVLDLYVVWEEHRGRCQINHTAEKKKKKKKRLPKGWIKGEEKGVLLCVQRKERQEGKSFLLVKELFWILSNLKTNCISLQHCSVLLGQKHFLNSVGGKNFEGCLSKSLLSILLISLLYIVTV